MTVESDSFSRVFLSAYFYFLFFIFSCPVNTSHTVQAIAVQANLEMCIYSSIALTISFLILKRSTIVYFRNEEAGVLFKLDN